MSSIKTVTNSSGLSIASITLKVVGVITILASLLDFIVLLIPPDFMNRDWQLAFVSQVVDRGIVPMVGIALLATGYGIDRLAGRPARGSAFTDLRFWAFLLSSFLGLVFLLFTVLHPNNVRVNSQTAIEQVQEQATLAEGQLQGRLGQEVQQQRSQINALLQNEQQLDQAIASGQIPQEQAEQLRQFRDDPAGLDQFINERTETLQQQLQTEIGTRREQATQQIKRDAFKSGVRIAVSSLLLAIGYIIIGWTGLRNLRAGE